MNDSNQNSSGDFSEDAVRRFLLGRLSADEQPDFERRLFLDSDLEARVRRGELDLTDDYACSRLSDEDRQQFEKRFLVSDDRKLKLIVSNALRDRFGVTQASSIKTTLVIKQLHSVFDFNRLAVRIAFSFALLVLIVGGAWLLIKKEPIKETITRVTRIRRPQPSTDPKHSHHPQNTSPRQAPSPFVEIVTLSPDVPLESGKAPTVNLPAGAHDIVRVELVVKADSSAVYEAQLSIIDGQTVVTAEPVKATAVTGDKIELNVPVSLLKAGDYHITLRRVSDTSQGDVAHYYFRVAASAR